MKYSALTQLFFKGQLLKRQKDKRLYYKVLSQRVFSEKNGSSFEVFNS